MAVPDANVAIACGASNLAVLDVDHGFNDDVDLRAFLEKADLPKTYTVRTGRRPEMGVQFYFEGAVPDVGLFKWHGCEGQVKSAGGYVMAAGSIHPDSGEAYSVISDRKPMPIPNNVRALRTAALRHTKRPYRAGSGGVLLEEVSKQLGHESIETTERLYSKWMKGRQDRIDALVTVSGDAG